MSRNVFSSVAGLRWFWALGITTIAAVSVAIAAEDVDRELYQAPWGEILGTGAKRPNAEQQAWAEEHMMKTKHVKMNALGLQRVNEHRANQGKHAVVDQEIVPFGAEPSAIGDTTTSGSTAPGSLPTYVDNSTLPSFPPIRSQGSLGSCAQFSAVYYTLTHMTALARGWDAKNGGDAYRFSPKWTYNMLNGGANVGTWHYDAYAIAIKHGLATWAEFPYDNDYRAWCLNPPAWRNALSVRASQTGRVLDVDSDAGLTQVKQLLVNGYVLNFATYISSWQWTTLKNDPATAADDAFAGKQCVAAVNGTSGGHAMTIVGFSDDVWIDLNNDGLVSANEKGALRIANSWGTGWGEAGFCWLSYNAIRTRNPASSSEGIFWYDEVGWVTARSSYTPQLIAEFTVNHLKRSQLGMTLGISATTAASPATTWSPTRVLSYAGGAYAFDGTTLARDGTFCLDLTDLAAGTIGAKRYYLGMQDSTLLDAATLKGLNLIDLVHGKSVACTAVPKIIDGGQVYATVDYDLSAGALPPEAVAIINPVSATLGIPMTFDGTASTSANGSIVSYQWAFGDGQTFSGPSCQYTYSSAGNFSGSLTVTDSAGFQDAVGFTVSIIDPNFVAAPSGLAASVSSRTVTLRWTDNSSNETGFEIYRAVKVNKAPLSYILVGNVPASVTSFSQAVAAGTYYYWVRAVNSNTAKASAASNAVSIRVR